MRLTIIAVCGILLTACGRPSDAPMRNEAAPLPASNVTAAPPGIETPEVAATGNQAPPAKVSPCLIQDGEKLRTTPVKALGTEPFWAARVEGRCVTYSTPEDQDGTRIWTRFSPGADGGTWTGSFEGRPFKLVTRPRPGCSDGMSDRRYPIEALLTVGGEERRGCAAPE